ncbi:MAG TPA: AAA family ATPase [Thermodesulfobacteriota bacterium]|nr:AAA family ATPase [Thermodesulfobacteriota bacterium]
MSPEGITVYHTFYHLKKEPFHITPDPEFLFLSPSHKQALESIIYGVKNRKGFILITGEVGVGKTTILRSYLEAVAKQKTKIIYIFNSNLSFQDLLKTIYKELGLEPKTEDVVEMLDGLYQILMDEFKQGNVVLLIVDEAQNTPIQTLEGLRMLSNLETSKEKLLQIVLTGQSEFEKMLNRHELRQLKQRVAIRSTIVPFTKVESMAYIKHRLAKVTLDERPVFTHRAMKRIAREAKGIPRTLNILCDNALITGFGHKITPVNTEVVEEVLADFGKKERPSLSLLKRALAPAALLSILAALLLIYSYGGEILWGVEKLIAKHKYLSITKAEKPDVSRSAETAPVKEDVKEEVKEIREVKPSEVKPPIEKPGISEHGPAPIANRPVPAPLAQRPAVPPVIRKVKEGDNLFRLTMSVYGRADGKLVAWVQQNNPWIKDINIIPAGKEIVFPEYKEKE